MTPVSVNPKSESTAKSGAEASTYIPVDLGFTSAGQRGFQNNINFGRGTLSTADASGATAGFSPVMLGVIGALVLGFILLIRRK